MANHSLICPFLTDDHQFAYGVEFGMLYARMRDGGEDVIDDMFLMANQEQILLLANRLGWKVEEIKRLPRPFGRDWFALRMVRPLQGR